MCQLPCGDVKTVFWIFDLQQVKLKTKTKKNTITLIINKNISSKIRCDLSGFISDIFKRSLDKINLPLTSHCIAFVLHANISSFYTFTSSFKLSTVWRGGVGLRRESEICDVAAENCTRPDIRSELKSLGGSPDQTVQSTCGSYIMKIPKSALNLHQKVFSAEKFDSQGGLRGRRTSGFGHWSLRKSLKLPSLQVWTWGLNVHLFTT